MQPFSPHNRFFSSIDQLERRLSTEKTQTQTQTQPSPFSSSPLYLTNPQTPIPTTTTTSSGPPLDFLSNSPITNDKQQQQQQQQQEVDDDVDDIETLMGLLGLPIPSQEAEKDDGSSYSSPSACSCDCSGGGGFYRKVVGLKGPKCEKERKRLDGWIDLYRRERREPARLVHLMIGKAVALSGESSAGFEGVEFPATVEEFLEQDSVTEKKR